MAGRSPARFVAPLALVAFALALFVVLDRTTGGSDDKQANGNKVVQPAGTKSSGKKEGAKKKKAKRKTYTVKAGDTPSGIAEKTGVPLATILQLNPDIDPQTLAPGQELKLGP
jgi:LysM repeat protein